jgi:hypothetical protein
MNTLTRTVILICSAAVPFTVELSADVLTLRTGESITGIYKGGTGRQIHMDLNGESRTYDVDQVQSLVFNDQSYPPPPPPRADSYPPPDRGNRDDRDNRDRQRDYPPVAYGPQVPAGTEVRVRMIESVDSERASLGQTFRASLDEPIYVNGQEALPRGVDVLTKLVEDRQSGRIQGRTVLTLALTTITFNGRTYDVTSTDVRTESSSRGERSGEVIGGTAVLGAIIGGLAGGGKGAAIGAASGAAVGTGAEVLTNGQRVRIPSETRLSFRLQVPLQL